MKKQLGNFRLLEQIEPGGYTTVYRAEEEMGQGFTRPAAVKILHAMDMDDERKIAVLRREVEVLVELSTCPNIVTIYGLGIDEEVGPWIAMALAGQSLKHFIGEEPAEPDQVRVLLRDALRSLLVVHGAEPPILHRDLKPNNMLSTDFGNWVIADFGLAPRWEADETVQLATVQYAAPELLDTTQGPESPRMDLYSLGMVAYEFALGRERYRKQFPSVYDPYADKRAAEGDLRPKWMYWHTSMQMTVPPIAEVIEDYPKDLSDLIAEMIVKPPQERSESASQALARLGEVDGGIALAAEAPQVAEEIVLPQRWRTPALAAVAVVAVLLCVVTFVWVRSNAAPTVHLDDSYVEAAPILVTGMIDRFPRAGNAEIELDDGSLHEVDVDDGAFTSAVVPREVRVYRGKLKIFDRTGTTVASTPLTVERIPPETVQVVLATYPVVPSAEVVITSNNRPGEPIRRQTDQDGLTTADVPYGDFVLEVNHPRYRPKSGPIHTGIEPQNRLPAIRMEEIPQREIYAEMRQLIDRIRILVTKKANCPPGPLSEAETGDLARRVAKLQELGEGDLDIEAFVEAVGGVRECEPDTLAAVETAVEVVKESITKKETELPAEEGGDGSSGTDSSTSQLIEQIAKATGADPEVIRQLIEAGADPEVIRQLIESGGDPETIKKIIQAATGVGPGGVPDLGSVSPRTLLRLPLNVFQGFIELNVPSGALTVEPVAQLNKVRVSGPLFNEDELNRLTNRLLPAVTRLQLELRVDAWAVCRRLEDQLVEDGAEKVRVHAHLTSGDNEMFVQFLRSDDFGPESVSTLARTYVIDPDLLFIQPLVEP
jgi:hypothetical protein